MASHKYKIREICGDWALDIHWGMETITLFFNSRNNADLVKAILEWEDAHPNEAVPYKPALTTPNEWVSVEDAMPPEHEPVLCIVDGKPKPNITLEDAYQIGSWNKADGWIIDEYLDWEDADVSWWMSLPAPPDKDNNVLAKTPNEPLTLEQLREMDGEPAWWDDGYGSCWGIISVDSAGMWGGIPFFRGRWREVNFEYNIEERKMKIYRRPPEGDADEWK